MYALAKPLLFSLQPDKAHAFVMASLAALEHARLLRALVRPKHDPRLRVHTMGLDFPSPIGLAAGFDKNAHRARALEALGFGFLELGTVTARSQDPNPRPNLFRLPIDRALVNRLGFPNDGAARVAARLGKLGKVGVPIGVSIGKSREVDAGDIGSVVADYTASFDAVRSVADFVVVNVSSPNTRDLRSLQSAALADTLLGALAERARAHGSPPPILVKVAPDLADREIDALCEVVDKHGLAGIVATNTTLQRTGLATPKETVDAIGAGGLSGPALRLRAREVVKRVREALPKATIVGVGGIERGADARAILDVGADLVQIYTAFIYRGPFTARAIARELLQLMVR